MTDHEIRHAVRLGAGTFGEIRDGLGVATNCGKCTSCAKAVIRDELARQCDIGACMPLAQPA